MKKKKTILTIALSFCALGFSQAQDVEKHLFGKIWSLQPDNMN